MWLTSQASIMKEYKKKVSEKTRKNVIKKVSHQSTKNMSIEVVKSQEKLRKV